MPGRRATLSEETGAVRTSDMSYKNMRRGRATSGNRRRSSYPAQQGVIRLACIVLSLGLTLAGPPPVRAAERHVCSSCSYKTIQAAVNAASSGDVVKVAQGTYYEAIMIVKNINLLGGYSPPDWTSQGDPSSTIINARGAGATIEIGSTSAIVDNFTITGGSGHYSPWHGWTRGGGLFIWADNNPTVIISDNIIEGNSAGEGGGVCVEGIESRFLNAQLLRNKIRNNRAGSNPSWGGGLTLIYTSSLLKENEIRDNTANIGGGFHIWKSAPTIDGNVITGNKAQYTSQGPYVGLGGAFFIELSSAFIKNNIIAQNQATVYADGIYIKMPYGPQPQIVNNTIVANKSSSGTNDGIFVMNSINPIIRNNIIALNGTGIRSYDGTVPSVMSNNDVWGNGQNYVNLPPGTNDISADPMFVDQAGGDYHLRDGSPCIDTGTSSNAPSSDFEGDPRPLDGNLDGTALWDIGADEHRVQHRLVITKEADPVSAEPSDDITFTITCRNEGGWTLTGVKITDTLSEDLLDPWFNPTFSHKEGQTYEWVVGNLDPGSERTIVIGARIDPSLATPGVIFNTAEGDSAETEPVSDDALTIVGGLKTYVPLALKRH